MRLVHVIVGLGQGGAETALYRLLAAAPASYQHSVLVLTGPGYYDDSISALGIEIRYLRLSRGQFSVSGLRRLRRWLHDLAPDLVVGWMYHANIAVCAASLFSRSAAPFVWNIRHSLEHGGNDKRSTRALIRLGALLSARPAAIVYNSTVSRRQHERAGYKATSAAVIHNGFEISTEVGSSERRRLRERYGVSQDSIVVGTAARYHPVKGHRYLFEAAVAVAARYPDVHFLLCGTDVTPANPEIARYLETAGLHGRVTCLGGLDALQQSFYPALDVYCLPSLSEGFPNAVGEAMAAGIPGVVTKVGEAPIIVGSTGLVVEPANASALAAALDDLLGKTAAERAELGRDARRRIGDNFSRDGMVTEFCSMFDAAGEQQRAARE